MASLGHTKSLAAMLLAGTALAVYGCGAAMAAEAGPAPVPAQAIGVNVNGVVLAPANRPQIIVPPSDQQKPGAVHTNVKLLGLPAGSAPNAIRPDATVPPPAGSLVETPASVACVYRIVPGFSTGCSPTTAATLPTGGARAIAVVTAFDYSAALSDLQYFSSAFGLAAPNFQVVYATSGSNAGCNSGPVPTSGSGTGWDLEAALSMQAIHSLAPGAKIFLIEAKSDSIDDTMDAVSVAGSCLQTTNGGQIVAPWSTAEFAAESSYDNLMGNYPIFVGAGDAPGTSYPAASPNAIGVGGTTFSRNQTTGAFLGEAVWNDAYAKVGTGGGPSLYESIPTFQSAYWAPLASLLNGRRGTPDLSALGDPQNGFWVYNTTYQGGWGAFGGTGLAASFVAAIANRAGFFWSSQTFLNILYSASLAGPGFVTDVNSGLCGPGGAANGNGQGYDPQWIKQTYVGVVNFQQVGLTWDWCTGWGTPRGNYN
jgi:kumamolisin